MRAAKLSDYIWARAEAGGRRRGRIWVGLLFAAAFACLAQDGRPTLAAAPQNNDKAASAGNTSNDAKPPVDGQANSTKQQKTSTESARRRQISDESTQLLAMAEALKVEVDKTTKDTLSLSVIRKADEIERLAKTVKDKMKQGSGQS
jgi:hypothetical protein